MRKKHYCRMNRNTCIQPNCMDYLKIIAIRVVIEHNYGTLTSDTFNSCLKLFTQEITIIQVGEVKSHRPCE